MCLQGSPEFVAVFQCVHYFEWKTYTACKKNKFKPHREVCAGTSDGLQVLCKNETVLTSVALIRNNEPDDRKQSCLAVYGALQRDMSHAVTTTGLILASCGSH